MLSGGGKPVAVRKEEVAVVVCLDMESGWSLEGWGDGCARMTAMLW